MPIRVLQALSGGQLGGTELMIHELVARLDREAFACEVSVLDSPGPITDRFAAIGVRVHDLRGARGYLRAAAAFRDLVRAGSYEVVHLYGFRMSLLGRFAAPRGKRRPVIVHGIRGLHVTEGTDVDSWRTRAAIGLERAASGWVDAYVANSEGAVEFLVSRGLPRDRFHVVRNGIDTSLWNGVRAPDGGLPHIVSVANFRPVKCLIDLVDALGDLRARGIRFRATVAGDGPLRPQLEDRLAARGLDPAVVLPGQLPPERVRALLAAATVFTLPSLWEGMPVSVMEAMSMSLPVVGTNVPGVRELVVHDQTGLLVPPREPRALADALQSVIACPARADEFGRAARLRILEHFDIAHMVSGHASVYRSLVACRRP